VDRLTLIASKMGPDGESAGTSMATSEVDSE